jgi:hypothetical protein
VVLAGVELGHVDINKAHIRVLEGGLRGGGEIAVARANANHQVGVARQRLAASVPVTPTAPRLSG